MSIRQLLNTSSLPAVIISLILFIIPFFWLTPGELELGGDSTRLFLYDPYSYLKTIALYSVEQEGTVAVGSNQYLLPFTLLLSGIYALFHSPYILTVLLYSSKLVLSFLFTYLIVKELLQINTKIRLQIIELASITSGLTYMLLPSLVENMTNALLTHNQIFLNPMIFYFLLRYVTTRNFTYMLTGLITTFFFAPNFSMKAPPPPFAFFPLAILFLLIYTIVCLKKPIPWRGLFVGLLLFLSIHAFHLIPVGISFLDPQNELRVRSFDKTSANATLDYFNAIVGLGKVSLKFFYTLTEGLLPFTALIAPLIIFLGFLVSKKRVPLLLLIAGFYCLTLYLVSANVSTLGVDIYRILFYIPGFGMFRNFFGQWQFVYAFFYSLLFGISLAIVLSHLKLKYAVLISFTIVILLVINAWQFLENGSIRKMHPGSDNVPTIFSIDPDYEKMLSSIKNIKDDGKMLEMPYTDYAYNVVAGKNTGAYLGQSMVMYIVGKSEFAGYQHTQPFSELFLKLVREKRYDEVKKLLSLFQIKYILYNNDPRVYDTNFPTFPYNHVRQSLPNNQVGLEVLVKNISGSLLNKFGTYSLFSVGQNNYLPKFYIPQEIITYEGSEQSFANALKKVNIQKSRPFIIESEDCRKIIKNCIINHNNNIPKISYKRINPTKYEVTISESRSPYFLVFLNKYNNSWKIYPTKNKKQEEEVSGKYFNSEVTELKHQEKFIYKDMFETVMLKPISETNHIPANGYANAWYMGSSNTTTHYIIEATPQRYFYASSIISVITLGVTIALFFVSRRSKTLFSSHSDKKPISGGKLKSRGKKVIR